jgi:hypothetical protein
MMIVERMQTELRRAAQQSEFKPSTIALLVSYSLARTIPPIGRTQSVTCLGIDSDAFGVAPIGRIARGVQANLNLVSHDA